MAAAPVAREVVKWLAGIIATLMAERALDEYEMVQSVWLPKKPPGIPPDVWRTMQKRYDEMCECTDDPEALELCRNRMIAELEASIPTRSSKR